MGQARTTLRDRSHERHFRRHGYAIVPLADPADLAPALEVYGEIDSGIGEGYYASIHSTDNAYKTRVDEALTPIIWPLLDRVLHDHESLVGAFMVKPPEGSSVVPLHQDWNTMDEAEGVGITCWVPLTPITEAEGKMQVLPGSHRFIPGLRGSPGFPQPYAGIADQIREEMLITLDVRVGDVLVMDGRVLHYTAQNRSGRTRVAAYFNALPRGAQPLHYYRRPDGEVEVYAVDRSFFTNFHIGDRPPGEPIERLGTYEVDDLDVDDVRRLAATARPRLGLGRAPRRSA